MMTLTDAALPKVVSRDEWLAARKALLAKERGLTLNYLDLTPLRRQQDWEEPSGRGDGPFMHSVRRHDRYENGPAAGSDSCCRMETARA